MKIFKLALVAAAMTTVTGCHKQLNEEPLNSFSAADAFSSAARIDKAAIGMYNALQNANYFGGRVLIYADIRGIDAVANTFFGNMNLFGLTKADDGTVASAWQAAYRTIYECNAFVANFTPNAALVTQAKADQYIGEAKFIRSLCYFYLVNLWAQPYKFTADASHLGVPLVLTATTNPFDPSNYLPRATVKQVYDQMEADLLDADSKLPATYSDAYSRTSKATKAAAKAALMRLYLYKGDNAKALQYANTIMGLTTYGLQSSPETPFRTFTTNESIFSVAMDGGDNPNTNNALGQHYGPTRRGDISVSDDFANQLEATDKRKTILLTQISGTYWSTKYNAGTTDWVPVFRYPEVLLTAAEVLATQAPGTTVDATAVGYVNQIRTRANATPIAPLTKAELLDLIARERRLELAFEGQGSLEFLRRGLGIPAHGIVSAQAYGSNYVVLPIPKYDLDLNTNLVKNPGY